MPIAVLCIAFVAAAPSFAQARAGRGIPPAFTAEPATSPDGWINEVDDYPRDAWLLRQGGASTSFLSVDPSGRPTHCFTWQTSGVRTLDARACELLMRRARFRPYTGEARGVYRLTTIWDILRVQLPQCSPDPCLPVESIVPEGAGRQRQ